MKSELFKPGYYRRQSDEVGHGEPRRHPAPLMAVRGKARMALVFGLLAAGGGSLILVLTQVPASALGGPIPSPSLPPVPTPSLPALPLPSPAVSPSAPAVPPL